MRLEAEQRRLEQGQRRDQKIANAVYVHSVVAPKNASAPDPILDLESQQAIEADHFERLFLQHGPEVGQRNIHALVFSIQQGDFAQTQRYFLLQQQLATPFKEWQRAQPRASRLYHVFADVQWCARKWLYDRLWEANKNTRPYKHYQQQYEAIKDLPYKPYADALKGPLNGLWLFLIEQLNKACIADGRFLMSQQMAPGQKQQIRDILTTGLRTGEQDEKIAASDSKEAQPTYFFTPSVHPLTYQSSTEDTKSTANNNDHAIDMSVTENVHDKLFNEWADRVINSITANNGIGEVLISMHNTLSYWVKVCLTQTQTQKDALITVISHHN